jgi:DnaJ domain
MNSSDPYKTLQVPHSANALEIKRAYRSLARKFHPDKFVGCPDEDMRYRASSQFAQCAAAYALLSDPKRKAEYDHVYKFGGFDAVEEPVNRYPNGERPTARTPQEERPYARPRKTIGIGYSCHDPCAFLWTQGKLRSRQTVAGVQIPSRIQSAGVGLRFAFSSGRVVCSPSGTTRCISETTQYSQLGKKTYTTTETITYHPDGRKEVIIVDGDGSERQFSSYPNISQQKELPWYSNAWRLLSDKLSMCFNPCAAVEAQQ